ncbi:MAG: tail fiber domain-containing protein, partial [Alphaproteobacteria bacterium]|nr:tail fiber domain-containing protein [Alphaproteobacteria bacterium]
ASFLGIPRAPTANAGTNTNQIATTQFVNTGINAIVGNPPATLNTLQSLAQALTNDPSFGTNLTNTVNTSLQSKAPVDRPSFLTYVMAPKLFVSSDASFNGKLFVSGDVSMNGNVKAGTIYEGGSSLITKYATLSAPTFTNRVVSMGDISANSRLFLSGDASFGGNLYIANDLSMNGRLLVSKTAHFAGDVSFNGNLAIKNQLQVNSNAVFETDVSMNNNVDISGAIIAHNNMNIYGVINQQAMNIYDGYFTSFDTQVITDVSSIKNLVNINTGGTNTIIGKSAGVTSGTNVTVIGNGATPSSGSVSNEITLGNSSISVLRCAATAITAVSDERDKTNIADLTVGMDFIKELRPVKFEWAMRDGGKMGEPDFGFIAQELLSAQEKVGENVPNLVITENPERLEASYAKLIPVLVKCIQELQESLDSVKMELNRLNRRK